MKNKNLHLYFGIIFFMININTFGQNYINLNNQQKIVNELEKEYHYKTDLLISAHRFKLAILEQEVNDTIHKIEQKVQEKILILERKHNNEIEELQQKSQKVLNQVLFKKKLKNKFKKAQNNFITEVSEIKKEHHKKAQQIKQEYQLKTLKLNREFKEKTTEINNQYKKKIKLLTT